MTQPNEHCDYCGGQGEFGNGNQCDHCGGSGENRYYFEDYDWSEGNTYCLVCGNDLCDRASHEL